MIKLRQLSNCQSNYQCLIKHFCTSNSSENLIVLNMNNETGYATVELNRPPVNSFNLEILNQFSKVLDNLNKNNCRGMTLTSVCIF